MARTIVDFEIKRNSVEHSVFLKFDDGDFRLWDMTQVPRKELWKVRREVKRAFRDTLTARKVG